MANKLTKDKARAIAQEYCSNGRKKREALKTVGYAKSYAECGLGMKLYDNILVKAEIDEIDTAKEQELQVTAKLCTKRFNDLYWHCVSVGDNAGAVRAAENHAKHIGYYEADKDRTGVQLQLNIAAQQAQIDEYIALGRALDDAPDAMAK